MRTDVRTGIYCLEAKNADRFNAEHVIPESFSKFKPSRGTTGGLVVLDCVCRTCNQKFGDTIDRALARDSVVGLLRYVEGRWGPREFKPPSRAAGVRVVVDELGMHDGADSRLVLQPDGTMGFQMVPGIAFAKNAEGPFEEFFPPTALPSRTEILARYGMKVAFQTRGVSPEELARLLRPLGFRVGDATQSGGPTKARVLAPPSREQFRAIAKIALNYLAAVAGPAIARMSQFNDLRAYIVRGEVGQGANVG
jgi:hypothetical protein